MDQNKSSQVVTILDELFSREERKLIPIFSGDIDDDDIVNWLDEAETVADSNNWNDSQKLKFFLNRLKCEAFNCHLESVRKHPAGNAADPPFSYSIWRLELIKYFRSEADIEEMRLRLSYIKQKPNLRTTSFF